MKTLLLLRHAKSSWKDSAENDFDRGLNKRGMRDAPRMGELLRDEHLVPDYIVSSAARRARLTTEYVITTSGFRGDVRLTTSLYEAPPEQIREVLRQTPEQSQRVLLVGHNPGLEEFLEQLCGVYQPLTTATLALFDVYITTWRELSLDNKAPLKHLWQPRELA